MKKSNHSKKIHQTKKGINLTNGFYLVLNPKTQKINVISISGEVVYIHDITRKITLEELVNLDRMGYLDIFDELILTKFKNKQGKE